MVKNPVWDSRCLVHIRKMDRQHETLVISAIRLQEALREYSNPQEIDQLFSDLIKKTRVHFQTEETLMQTYDYPHYTSHKKLHDLLLQQVEDSQNTQMTIAQLHQQSWIDKQELADFLGDWLMTHILEEDNKLGVFLRQHGLQ